MWKMIGLTILGFALFSVSIGIGYVYLQRIENGDNPWYLLVATIVCVIASAVAILFAGQTKNIYAGAQQPLPDAPTVESGEKTSIVEQNNQLISQWRKTANMRDKMKMIKVTVPTLKERQQTS